MEDTNTTAVFKEQIDILGDITMYHEGTARRSWVKLSTKTVSPVLSKGKPPPHTHFVIMDKTNKV